ncbi:hypothetical protein [Mesorhizobium sp.]|uniref:hypothetical protein n=2 Tax=Mesorhizobium sp. TaxID=1871066 RepID=UPI0025D984DB|nr:hypothetical protein [Mesorhizobium sp.]
MSPKSAQRFWANDMRQNKDLKRSGALAPELLFRYSQAAKVNVMDTRTLLILGLGIIILLALGFFALPS